MRVTFSAIPAFGHVFPLVPLASAMAAAGHDVTFAASSDFAGRLPGRVVQGVPEGLTLAVMRREAASEMGDRGDPFAFSRALFGSVMPRYMVPRLLDDWAQTGLPDLVVHDGYNLCAAVAAGRAGVPAVAFHILLTPPDLFILPLMSMADLLPAAFLDPTPPSWRHGYGPDGLERLAIRSVAWSDPDGTVPAALLDGEGREKRPAAYLTLGTVSFGAVEILRRSILEAATTCPLVIVAAGPESDPALLGELPPNVHVERFVDQARVLDHVRVAVHHGGTGTTLGCLAAGVPQVITPQGADHVLNAGRLAELGLGAVVDNDARPGALGDALDRVLGDPALLERVQAVRDEVAAMPHPEQVVETLDARFGR